MAEKTKLCKTCVNFDIKNTHNLTRSVQDYIGSLDTGQHWATTELKFYFFKSTDIAKNDPETARDWTDTQKNNWRTAIESWENVCALNFTETSNINETDIKLILIDDNSYPYLGHAYFPGDSAKGENYVSYNNADDKNFTVGSYDYITMVHEFGHTIGLAHPHDTGGSSTTFPGVSSWSDLGTGQQNQTVYSVMSYNDINGPLTPNIVQSFGFIGGPMAYDIASIQHIYGNVSNQTGNNVYTLPSTNSTGTFFTSIHDTGGTDTINAGNINTDVIINLNAATIDADGGEISKVNNISGGFTIAQGTDIENAIGGSGNDQITGNELDNVLKGGDGNDTISGGAGNDYIEGGDGNDNITGGQGDDIFRTGPGIDTFDGQEGNNDTVHFPGSMTDYTYSKSNDYHILIGINSYYNLSGETRMKNVEFVHFEGENQTYPISTFITNGDSSQSSDDSNQNTDPNSGSDSDSHEDNNNDGFSDSSEETIPISTNFFDAQSGRNFFKGRRRKRTLYVPGNRNNYFIYKLQGKWQYLVKGDNNYISTAGESFLKGIWYIKFADNNRRFRLNRMQKYASTSSSNIGPSSNPNEIVGSTGFDRFYARSGTQKFDGYRKSNRIYFRGRLRNYKIYRTDGWTVFKGKGRYYSRTMGTTYVKNIKFVKFNRYRRSLNISRIRNRN